MISLLLLLVLGAIAYFYSTRNFDYWKKRGVKHDKPIPLFGTNKDGFLLIKGLTQVITDQYRKYPEERVVGFLRSTYPELIIRDADIAKRILLTDFNYFHERKFTPVDTSVEILLQNLFTADGDLWRLLRQRLTPAFTSGKLKAMFPLIVERAERLHLRIQAAAGAPIDARDLMARFTTDVIGACGFGLDMDALSDDDSEFRKLGRKIFEVPTKLALKGILKFLFPRIFKHIVLTKHFADDVIPLVQTILQKRNYEPSPRNDFIDLLLECRKKGVMVGESIEHFNPDGTPKKVEIEMTDGLLAAQAFVFFAAGFETSSSTSSFTLHLLAYHPDIQRKVQKNIDEVLNKYDNKLCYEAIKDMDYLEWAFKESMRLMPAIGFLMRSCTRQYTIPDVNITIDEGVKVLIPVHAMQNDPEYFESPEEFRPERFDPKIYKNEKLKYVYLPFGEGPRACIGERLGIMQAMAGIAAVLSKFTVKPAPTSVRDPVFDQKASLVLEVSGGLPMLFCERKKVE